jgi:cytochrome c553
VSPRRLLALLTLVAGGTLAVAIPAGFAGPLGYNPTPRKIINTAGVPAGPISQQPGSAVRGKKLFVTFCGRCHVMEAAHTKGTLGPNLDRDQVGYSGTINAIVQGVGGIQAEYLQRALTFAQIYDVAKITVLAARG